MRIPPAVARARSRANATAYRMRHTKACPGGCGRQIFKVNKQCVECYAKVRVCPSKLIHGLSRSYEHRVWREMIQRCTNPKNNRYRTYGGRGITVCERWMVFENFIADMGPRPEGKTPGGRALYSIDRKNNDGPYAPWNCKWSTPIEQAQRTTRSRAA